MGMSSALISRTINIELQNRTFRIKSRGGFRREGCYLFLSTFFFSPLKEGTAIWGVTQGLREHCVTFQVTAAKENACASNTSNLGPVFKVELNRKSRQIGNVRMYHQDFRTNIKRNVRQSIRRVNILTLGMKMLFDLQRHRSYRC